MPSSKTVVVEALLYTAFLTLVMSRRLLALVRRRLAAMADRIPGQRWAAIFASVTLELLAAAVRPLRDARVLLRDLARFLLHEAVDPNAGRQGLLTSVEQRTHRLHPMAAAA
jgi:hypothetical protein